MKKIFCLTFTDFHMGCQDIFALNLLIYLCMYYVPSLCLEFFMIYHNLFSAPDIKN